VRDIRGNLPLDKDAICVPYPLPFVVHDEEVWMFEAVRKHLKRGRSQAHADTPVILCSLIAGRSSPFQTSEPPLDLEEGQSC
jgi:hypothetical protein